jgi:hypothetical protein
MKKKPNFLNDKEKMVDFNKLSKENFLKSYSYITEEEYNETKHLKNKLNAVKKVMEQIGNDTRQDYLFFHLDQAITKRDYDAILRLYKEASPRTPFEQIVFDTAEEMLKEVFGEPDTKEYERQATEEEQKEALERGWNYER